MKVNIELLKEAQRIRREHSEFCQDCGETDPPNGFYPMGVFDSESISDLLCNECEAKRRAPQFEGYCMRCREKRAIEGAVISKTLKGRPVVKGVCPVCGLRITRFVSRRQVEKIEVKPGDSPLARAVKGLPPGDSGGVTPAVAGDN